MHRAKVTWVTHDRGVAGTQVTHHLVYALSNSTIAFHGLPSSERGAGSLVLLSTKDSHQQSLQEKLSPSTGQSFYKGTGSDSTGTVSAMCSLLLYGRLNLPHRTSAGV